MKLSFFSTVKVIMLADSLQVCGVSRPALVLTFALLACSASTHAKWPMLRGGPQHSGYVDAQVPRTVRLEWAVEFENERLGTSMEPIIQGGRMFIGTHAGHLYALNATSAAPLWRFEAGAPFLHSPAVDRDVVVAGSTDGFLYGLETATGKLRWKVRGGPGGFSAAPTIADATVFAGTRHGDVVAVALATGRELWRRSINAPVRQAASVFRGRVFVAAEDLKVRAFSADIGALLWTSVALPGQSARDYYPVLVESGGRLYVLVRTNPLLNMGQRIGVDRTMLTRSAGVDDSSWQKLDAWIKSGQRGDTNLWENERLAILRHLESKPDAQTLFVIDAETGKQSAPPPILWAAGCQGVGAPPALTGDGRLLVFHRSVYGNWNHGVAPLVALGLLDLKANRITPLFHQQGAQPRWNAFWGTADETQNFTVAAQTVLIVHQGTLSGFDLRKNELFTLFGERDRYGGYRNPPWARNEWHGPGRAGVALSDERIYWQTGSRILCLAAGSPSRELPTPIRINAANVPASTVSARGAAQSAAIQEQIAALAREILSTNWAPLFVDPGLSGRDFSFDHARHLFEAIAWAFPHLPPQVQNRARENLQEQWSTRPPFSREAWLPLTNGAPREWATVPAEYRARLGSDRQPHHFAGVHAAWWYGERCGEWSRVDASWPAVRAAFQSFGQGGWRLDPAKGDLYANVYLASLRACEKLSRRAGDEDTARQAADKAAQTEDALVAWWARAGAGDTLRSLNTSSELDPFIGKGDGLSFSIAPHRHKVALHRDLTPAIAAVVRRRAPNAVENLERVFQQLYCTWHIVGEERQVHFGENFIDPPDLALGGFMAKAWLTQTPAAQLERFVDLPFCRADLYHLQKLAILLETHRLQADSIAP